MESRSLAFADWLCDLPLDDWLAIGRTGAGERTLPPLHPMTRDRLRESIASQRLELAAWTVRDAVETAAFIASASRTRWTRADQRAFAAARAVAEDTALAILIGARTWCRPRDRWPARSA